MDSPKSSSPKGSHPSSTPLAGHRLAPSIDKADSSDAPHADADAPISDAAGLANATIEQLKTQLPPLDTRDASSALPAPLFRAHIRTPTAAGLPLHIDLPAYTTTAESHNSDILEGHGGEQLRHSATAPIAIQEGGHLRSALSAASMTGSLSPGSAFSSPMLNALTDLTPLPSPLVMSDSPGPWARAGAAMRPRSRGASSASVGDDALAMLGQGTLSPSPSQKKKSYQRLRTAAAEAAGASLQAQHKNEANRERNRSLSELVPDALHNIRARHVTIASVAPEQMGADGTSEPHLHREAYLAAQRGLVSATAPAGLPTPPASNASNASNRSVTESESEDVAEEDKVNYIAVRHGPQRTKKLWRPVRQLGQGTFSKVYLATSERLAARDPPDESVLDPHKLVAIKVVEHGPAGGADEERVELSLKREVEMLRSISHPSLVHLKNFDYGEAQALLVLTYCPGGDLFDVASAHRELLGVDIVQRIFAELVSAVRYLHDKLIVHRDIKLESTFLRSLKMVSSPDTAFH